LFGVSLPSIDAEGWRYTYPDPLTTYDPVGDPITITVTSPGFTAAATAASVTRVLPITGRIDELHPNEGVLTPNVSLAERVYKDCTIPEVTNNSTHNYLQPQAVWLTKDRQRATGTNFDVELLVTHGHARSGRAVAGVRFIATDESANSVTVDVNATTLHTWSVTNFCTDAFKAAIPLAGLTQGDVITIDAIIYPWVGEAWQLSVDGYAYGTGIGASTLKALNDRTGAYGTVYAYVATDGDNSTGVASTTPATAAADPFATCGAALVALRSFNNTNYSRNEPGGSIVRLLTGAHLWGGYTATSDATQDMVCIIEAAPSATPVIVSNAVNYRNSTPRLVEFIGIEVRRDASGNNFLFQKPDDSWVNISIFDDVNFNLNGYSANGAILSQGGRRYFFGCTGDNIGQSGSFSDLAAFNSFGCTGDWCARGFAINIVGCDVGTADILNGDHPPSSGVVDGRIHACNRFIKYATAQIQIFNNALSERGYGRICNIIEHGDDEAGGPALQIYADGVIENVANVVIFLDGLYGSGQFRAKHLYGNGGTGLLSEGVVKFCVWNVGNIKGDSFENNGSNTNQSVRYQVNQSSNTWYNGTLGNQVAGYTDNYKGDIVQMHTVYGTFDEDPLIVMDFANPKYFGAAGASAPYGGGDYTPGASYAGALIPAGFAPCAHDIYGRVIPNDGTAFAGPIQAAP
jgi:hypothetical protein